MNSPKNKGLPDAFNLGLPLNYYKLVGPQGKVWALSEVNIAYKDPKTGFGGHIYMSVEDLLDLLKPMAEAYLAEGKESKDGATAGKEGQARL